LGAAIVAALAFAACGGTTSSAPSPSDNAPASLKIMVGGMNKQIYLPNMLTKQLGFFKDYNLDVTLIDEGSGQASEEEVIAGNVEAGSGSYNHTIEIQPKGKFIEQVVQFQIAPGEAEVVDAKKADSIKTAKDLKGKSLGVTSIGSGTHTLTMAILGKAGIASADAKYVPVGAGNTFIAGLTQQKIDAGMTTEPTISRAVKTGVGKVLIDLRTPESTRAALGGDYPFIGLFIKPVVQRLVNAYVKTLKWINTHTTQEIVDKMPADYYAGDKDLYTSALEAQKTVWTKDGKMPKEGAQTVLDISLAYVPDMKGAKIDIAKTYTNEFTNKAS
jgi:NitT/TauT family transport system substrate-binding protein